MTDSQLNRLTVDELLRLTSYAGDPKALVNQYKDALADTMRENERLRKVVGKMESIGNELIRGLGDERSEGRAIEKWKEALSNKEPVPDAVLRGLEDSAAGRVSERPEYATQNSLGCPKCGNEVIGGVLLYEDGNDAPSGGLECMSCEHTWTKTPEQKDGK